MIRSWINNMRRSQSGSALPMVALGIFVLTGAAGSAIDMGRVQMVQAKLSNSLDAAGLAVGSEASSVDVNLESLKYFNVNYPTNFLGSTVHDYSVATNTNNEIITLSVKADVPTLFMQLFGIPKITVSAASQITRQSSGMELVLVLDNTGSMNSAVNPGNSSTPKITALQNASATLLNTLYGSRATIPNLWVGVVPFSQAVNIGTGYPGWMDTAYDNTLDFGPTIAGSCPKYLATSGTYASTPSCTYKLSNSTIPTFNMTNWQGCVMARPSPYDVSDDVPSTSPFQAYNSQAAPDGSLNYNPWKVSTSSTRNGVTTMSTVYAYPVGQLGVNEGPNALCPVAKVLPMVAEKSTVVAEINSMTAMGSTEIPLGMSWAYRMLSPNWRNLWGGEMDANALPLNYHTPLMNKVVILMTDGMNSLTPGNYTAYKFLDSGQLGSTNQTVAETALNTRTLTICNSLKAKGVIIYTIGFGTNGNNNPSDPTSVNGPLLQACASNPSFYFLAPTNAQLQNAFQQIGDSLANLRISQ